MAEAVIDRLSEPYPGIREQIEIVDVATPATYVRYADNWRGATMKCDLNERYYFDFAARYCN